jgi:hypothetical protein
MLSFLITGKIYPVSVYERFYEGWSEGFNPVYNNGRIATEEVPVIGQRKSSSTLPKFYLDLASYSILEPYLLAIKQDFEIDVEMSGEPVVYLKSIKLTSDAKLLLRTSAPERSHFPIIRKWLNQSDNNFQESALAPLHSCTNKSMRLFASLMKCNVVLSKFSPMLANFEAPFKLITQYKKSLLEGETYEAIKVISDVSSSMRDGHGAALDSDSYKEQFMPPFSAQFVGEELRINYIKPELSELGEFKINDKIELINGKSPTQILGELANQLNYSTPWELKAKVCYLGLFFAGPQNSTINIQVDGKGHKLQRTTSTFDLNATLMRPKFQWFGDHIVYMNISAIKNPSDIEPVLKNPALKGLIIDTRGEPKCWVLKALRDYYAFTESNLLQYKTPFLRGRYIDEQSLLSMAGFDSRREQMPKALPMVAALTDGYSISQQEEITWRVRHALKGKVFGEQTAGSDGNYTILYLLDGIRMLFTGMAVIMPDGKDINRNGIAPDYIVPSNYQGGDLMKDHVFLAALGYMREQGISFESKGS